MRTLPLLALLGCNTFTTVDEACLDAVPGSGAVARATDLELFDRANCHRRLAKRPKLVVERLVQQAVEGHRDWLEINAPRLSPFSQRPSTEGFTGTNAKNRLDAEGFTFISDSALLEIMTIVPGDLGIPTGGEYFDFWFEDPFVRPAWLQSVIYSAGAAEADYTLVYDPDLGIEDEPVHLQYWNIIYSTPPVPYAEVPVAYPRNGQLDVPPDYVHLSSNTGLELGGVYGFPITFTVGSTETGLDVMQASIRGPEGSVPFILLFGAQATTGNTLQNSVVLVPEDPFQTGGEYQVDVRIKTDQGERRATTAFTVSGESRPIPGGFARRAAEGVPAYDVQFKVTDLADLTELGSAGAIHR
jgi:hypothetical protein